MPPPRVAVLPLIVLQSITAWPPSPFAIPPPRIAWLRVIVLDLVCTSPNDVIVGDGRRWSRAPLEIAPPFQSTDSMFVSTLSHGLGAVSSAAMLSSILLLEMSK